MQEVPATPTNLPPPKVNHPTAPEAQQTPVNDIPPDSPLTSVEASRDPRPDTSEGSNEEEERPAATQSDPYANLDGAFTQYVADEPRPVQHVPQAGLDDELF